MSPQAWILALGAMLLLDTVEPWVSVVHRQFPLSFEVPENTSLRRISVFTLARPRTNDLRRIEVDVFGLRPLPGNAAAVQVGFFWVTDDYRGAEAETFEKLATGIRRAGPTAAFLNSVFFRGLEVEHIDRGTDLAASRPARRVAIARRVATGTTQERRIDGEVFVVPIDQRSALVVVAHFAPGATPAEREKSFPRLLRSVRIGDPKLLEPVKSASAPGLPVPRVQLNSIWPGDVDTNTPERTPAPI